MVARRTKGVIPAEPPSVGAQGARTGRSSQLGLRAGRPASSGCFPALELTAELKQAKL